MPEMQEMPAEMQPEIPSPPEMQPPPSHPEMQPEIPEMQSEIPEMQSEMPEMQAEMPEMQEMPADLHPKMQEMAQPEMQNSPIKRGKKQATKVVEEDQKRRHKKKGSRNVVEEIEVDKRKTRSKRKAVEEAEAERNLEKKKAEKKRKAVEEAEAERNLEKKKAKKKRKVVDKRKGKVVEEAVVAEEAERAEIESSDSDETDREGVDTSDDEWEAAYNTLKDYRREKVDDRRRRRRRSNRGGSEGGQSQGTPSEGGHSQGAPSEGAHSQGAPSEGAPSDYVFVSEYEDSEGEMDPIVDSDEEPFKKKKRVKVDARTDFKTFKWELGMLFRSGDHFKEAVTLYGLREGYNLHFTCAGTKVRKYKAVCQRPCKFSVYASWDKEEESYVVKSLKEHHTCTRDMANNKLLKDGWCANHYIITFRDKPNWSGKEIRRKIKEEFGIIINKWKAYHIRRGAAKLLHGSMKEHYAKFGSYIEELKRSNPTSVFILYTVTPLLVRQPVPVFQRFFVCFDALRNGLLTGCRRVLVIDAAFLKTFLGGTILSAIGVDGNNQMFPLAWAVAEGENNSSWVWFLSYVKQVLETPDGGGWTIISDQHKAIHHAVATVLPTSEHRNCARHIYANWNKQHRGEDMKFRFWECVNAWNENDFVESLANLRDASSVAAEHFTAQNPRTFCRAFMNPNTKCQYVVSNMAETFNAYIVRARAKHVLFMLEDIRLALMERICLKKQEMEKANDSVYPRVRKRLEEQRLLARGCSVSPSTETIFQVAYMLDAFHVDVAASTCTCRMWDLSGVPCHHAIACAAYLKRPAEDFLSPYFKKDMYLRAYDGAIMPCVGEKQWPKKDLPLDPPEVKVGPGRPKKNRKKVAHEDPKRPGKLTKHGRVMTCGRCKRVGHNRRGCPLNKEDGGRTGTQDVGSSIGDTSGNADGGRTDTQDIGSSVAGDGGMRGTSGSADGGGMDTGDAEMAGGRANRGRGRGNRGRGRGNRGRGRGIEDWLQPV